ncbi:hypothetical protein HXX76_003681 [Chlamydomonas incerta]|uniref:JmjC domain-containing protein n=1 Tax=Chlamydomonas incerta TaxID=51695 RepID=A0A835TLG1_CHLIN|nr:hypothetical protein HXX76_003681 [Chlamydomonas incerta]|eukprot:KAG2440826.1 hypothetical protein HXX76_003681 [Chlamydomonas incerta]
MASREVSNAASKPLASDSGAAELSADAKLRSDGLGSLSVLPDHLLSYIMYLLDLEDLVRLGCVSRLLRVLGCEEPLWLALSLKHQEGLVNWRQTALASYRGPKAVPPEAVAAAARPPAPLPGLASLFLYKRWYRCHVDLRGFLPPPDSATVPRVAAGGAAAGGAAMSPAEFRQRFDGPGLPVLLQGLQDGWPAASWTLPALCEAFPAAAFKVTKPHGGRALMTLPAYTDYMARQADEEPLYIFDPDFVEAAPGLRQLYDIPAVFDQDYFGVLPGGGRPHHRWLVLGPARAGASWHVDPSLTSAWNALLSGRKRWALYPPHSPPPGVPLSDDGEEARPSDADGLTSLQWWLEVWPSLPPERRPIEFVQEPGEVVYIPGGWWHAVLNLETAVAVTQNFVCDANLPRVVAYMAAGSSAYFRQPLSYYSTEEVGAWRAAYPGPMAAADAAAAAAEKEREKEEESDSGSDGGSEEGRDLEAEGDAAKRGGGESSDLEGSGSESGSDPVPSCLDENGVGGGGGEAAAGDGGGGGDDSGGCSIRPLASCWLLGPSGVSQPALPSQGLAAAPAGAEMELETGGSALLPLGPRPAGAVATAAAGSDSSCRTRAMTGTEKEEQEAKEEEEGGEWHGPDAPPALRCWRRERILGRWLRRLWEQRPELRPALGGCLAASTAAPAWAAVLAAVARQHNALLRRAAAPPPPPVASVAAGGAGGAHAAHGGGGGNGLCNGHADAAAQQPPPAQQAQQTQLQAQQTQLQALQALLGAPEGRGLLGLELMPLVGADALVFLLGAAAGAGACAESTGSTADTASGSSPAAGPGSGAHGVAVKVFTHELPAVRGLMCALEAHVPLLLRGRPAAGTAAGAPPGAADSGGGDAAAAAAAAALAAAEQVPLPASCGLLSVRFPEEEAPGPGDAGGPRSHAGGRRRGCHHHSHKRNDLLKVEAPEQVQGLPEAAVPGSGRPGAKRSAAAAALSPGEVAQRKRALPVAGAAEPQQTQKAQQAQQSQRAAVQAEAAGQVDGAEEQPQPQPAPPQEGEARGREGPPERHVLLYLVEQRMQGSHVLPELWDQLCDDQRRQLATALGHLIGRMHRAAAAAAASFPATATAATAAATASATAAADLESNAAEVQVALAAPPPRAALAGVGISSWESLLRSRGVWHDRYGRIWVSGLGRVCSPHSGEDSDSEEDARRDDGGGMADGGGGMEAGTMAEAGEGAAAAAPAAGAAPPPHVPRRRCHVPLDSPWWPFVSHLRRRQRRLLRRLEGAQPPLPPTPPAVAPAANGSSSGAAAMGEGAAANGSAPANNGCARTAAAADDDDELPMWVRQQLPGYLPEDPAQLLGFQLQPEEDGEQEAVATSAGAGAGPGVPPLLLHGDVTSSNVVLQPPPQLSLASPQQQAAGHDAIANGAAAASSSATAWAPVPRLVDFSDAGHGDPLLELVPVLASCLGCHVGHMRAFWAAYTAHVDPLAAPGPGSSSSGGAHGGCAAGAEAGKAAAADGAAARRVWPLRGAGSSGGSSSGWRLALSYVAMCYCLLHEEVDVLLARAWGTVGAVAAAGAVAAPAAAVAGGAEAHGAGGAATLQQLATALWGFLDEHEGVRAVA